MEQKPSYNLHTYPKFISHPDRGCMIHQLFKGLFSQNLWKVIKFWLNIFKKKSLVLAEENFPRNLEVFSKNYIKGPNNSFILVENSGLVHDWSSGSLLNPCKSLQNCLVDFSHCCGLLKGNHLNRRIKYLSNTSTCFFFFFHNGYRCILKSKRMVNGHPDSSGYSENLSHPIKKTPKAQGISSQALPNSNDYDCHVMQMWYPQNYSSSLDFQYVFMQNSLLILPRPLYWGMCHVGLATLLQCGCLKATFPTLFSALRISGDCTGLVRDCGALDMWMSKKSAERGRWHRESCTDLCKPAAPELWEFVGWILHACSR